MFRTVNPKPEFHLMEEAIQRYWQVQHIFEKTDSERRGGPEFVFYEGPPSMNGQPGVHHVLSRAVKDLILRYKVMRGYHVTRRAGWDTHGLPVEIEVEQQLGINNKKQIEAYGIDRFNELCRRTVFTYIQDWIRLTERIAFWVNLEDAYVTYTNDYIESVWWIIKSFWEKQLLYQGLKVVPYCPRCGTPLSYHEVSLGYAEAQDPSIYVRLPLAEDPGTSLLIWTTTPWTLPANVAVAAHPDQDYVIVEHRLDEEGGIERLILAKALVKQVFGDRPVKVFETFKGATLKGLRYRPLFTYLVPDKPAYTVINETFVSMEEGTGLVHIAPAFGAEDLEAAERHNLPMLHTLEADGTFSSQIGPWRGQFVKEAEPGIIADLERRGLLLRSETITHTYPFCWRCDTPLLYFARKTWFLRTTQYKDQLVELNEHINWEPEHIKKGRFGNWLENNVDWALGRERYWGTPLPVWECEKCSHQLAVGSIAELAELCGEDWHKRDLHRPYVDSIHFPCPECEGEMRRVPEVLDVWFDSGSMPLAQWHYPFENQERFTIQYPADFISEAVDQTRGWFYSLHAISTLLFEQEAFRNVICLGLVLNEDGLKMSKKDGTALDPWELIQANGADALRWYFYTASQPWQERRFQSEQVNAVVRSFSLTLWNVFSFFTTYANLDGWLPGPATQVLALLRNADYNSLDRWLLSELHGLVLEVTEAYERYDIPAATRPIEAFVERLSNWYLRRSRRRFWKGEADADRQAAYAALYETLVTVSKLLAPAMPYLADELYQNLVHRIDENTPASVHLAPWPDCDASLIDESLNQEMELVMKLASLGHAARNQAGLKVRQPLQEAAFAVGSRLGVLVVEKYVDLLADELNVRQVRLLGSAGEAVSYRLKPLPKQLGQKYQERFPQVREALLLLEPEFAASELLAGRPLEIAIDGDLYSILPDEVEVIAQPHSGRAVAMEGTLLVALATDLTPDLIQEGLAREFIRRVQELRKQAGLQVAERISLRYVASGELARAVHAYHENILQETLAKSLEAGEPEEGMETLHAKFDNETLLVGLSWAPHHKP
jgi:isoleucyl-tRNA synthetase